MRKGGNCDEDIVIMKYQFGKHHWKTHKNGMESNYLLANGLGGFCAQDIMGSCSRNDHGLLMAAVTVPNERVLLLSQFQETLAVDDKAFDLSSQIVKGEAHTGYKYLQSVVVDGYPEWTYQVAGVELRKKVIMVHGENTVLVRYEVWNPMNKKVKLTLIPYVVFAPKGHSYEEETTLAVELTKRGALVKSEKYKLYLNTKADLTLYEKPEVKELHYAQEDLDGRMEDGKVVCLLAGSFETEQEWDAFEVCGSMEDVNHTFAEALEKETKRREALLAAAGLQDEHAKELVYAADKFVTDRASTAGKTILAGFSFFGDWGRDTMIAMLGCTIATGQYETSKSIFRTFMKYCNKGIMPNLFPEGEAEPMYNTVDASLLFINAVYEYIKVSKDTAFLKEAYPVMQEVLHWYRVGTDYHISMDEDGLIMAGAKTEQLTWMDVRIDDFLPTPRHGKPVEINGYWYNALKIMELYAGETKEAYAVYPEENQEFYGALAEKVKESFLEKFWMEDKGYLKDVVAKDESGKKSENQIRCNQIWTLSMPFTMVDKEQGRKILYTVYEKLYTPLGLRSLAPEDEEFHSIYEGEQKVRDMAYHQGTVWGFPLGAYYLAYLSLAEDKNEACQRVRKQLEPLEAALKEGCVGALAEVYDGENPNVSKGCYAQAWSVGEILRVYKRLEEMEA